MHTHTCIASECPQSLPREELVHDILARTVGKPDPKWDVSTVHFLNYNARQISSKSIYQIQPSWGDCLLAVFNYV